MLLGKGKAGIVSWMILAFLAYFLAEGILRQATISNINPQTIDVGGMVLKLPSSLRESVNYNIEKKKLRNAVKEAKTDSEKVSAIINLAEQGKEPGQRLWLYTEIFKEYPNVPETGMAYSFFLLNEDAGPKVSPDDFQKFILRFDALDSYNMWVLGANRLAVLRPTDFDGLLKFLSPLLSRAPEYRDYGPLYQQIAAIATKVNDKNAVALANSLTLQCKSLMSFDEALRRRAEAEAKAAKEKSSDEAKAGKGT